tara:strand:- start:229 stop:1395 length:1167 start_codon:yes stop_codon:yes gene_type:complete
MKQDLSIDNKIDIVDLVHTLWENKFLIISITIIFGLIGIVYISMNNSKYKLTLQLAHIPYSEIIKYDKINAVTNYIDIEYQLPSSIREEYRSRSEENRGRSEEYRGRSFVITSESLIDLYIDELKTKKVFEEILIGNKSIDFSNLELIEEYKNYTKALAQNIKFEKMSDSKSWKLLIDSVNNLEISLMLLKYALDLAQTKVKNNIENVFSKYIEVKEIEKEMRKIQLNDEIKNSLFNHEFESENRIAFLKEQAIIAKVINLETPKLLPDYSDLNMEMPYYLLGFRAIEEEIRLIQERGPEEREAFVKNLPILYSDLMKNENRNYSVLKDELTKSPLGSNEAFIAASFNFDSVNIKLLNPKLPIIVMTAIFGFIFSILLVITRSILSKK